MKWAKQKLLTCLAWCSAYETLRGTHIILLAAQGAKQLSSKAKALIEAQRTNFTLALPARGKSRLKTN